MNSKVMALVLPAVIAGGIGGAHATRIGGPSAGYATQLGSIAADIVGDADFTKPGAPAHRLS